MNRTEELKPKEQLINMINEIEDDKLINFLIALVQSFKKKWGI